MSIDVTVADNPGESRYEARLGDDVAGVAAYTLDGDTITFTHTEAYVEHQGIGSAIVKHALADVRERGLAVVPQCPFVRHYLQEHPEAADLA